MAISLSFRALLLAALFAAFTLASTFASKPGQAPPQQLTQQQISDIQAWASAEIKRTVSPAQISAWKRMSNNLHSTQKTVFLQTGEKNPGGAAGPLVLAGGVGGAVCAICSSVMGVAITAKMGSFGCDVACASAAEAIGGGPEDPLADAVAGACIPLCAAATSTAGKAAGSAGGAYFACHSVFPAC